MAVCLGFGGIFFFFSCVIVINVLSHCLYSSPYTNFFYFYKKGLESFLVWLLQPLNQHRPARQNLSQLPKYFSIAPYSYCCSFLQGYKRYSFMSPQAGFYYLLLLFLEVLLSSRWVALFAISSFSLSPCPNMKGRLKLYLFGKSLVVWHLRYAE